MSSKFSFILSVLLVLFGLFMVYRGLTAGTTAMNLDTAMGTLLVVYGISRYFLYSRLGRPRP